MESGVCGVYQTVASGAPGPINMSLAAIRTIGMDTDFEHIEYDREARRRWGHTSAYRESAARVAGYGEAEWRSIRAEAEEIAKGFAELLREGEPPSGERAQALAVRHRDHISRWFYPCSPEMHRKLGELYVSDERFGQNYERHAPGLSRYLHDAIAASARE